MIAVRLAGFHRPISEIFWDFTYTEIFFCKCDVPKYFRNGPHAYVLLTKIYGVSVRGLENFVLIARNKPVVKIIS